MPDTTNNDLESFSQAKKNFWLYVLRLEQDKYYVGITTQTPEIRMKEHLDKKRPAYWTMKYKPIEIDYTKDLDLCTKEKAEEYENIVVRKYMKKYGNNNVRGGDLTDIEEYSFVFGHVLDKTSWQTILYLVFLNIVIIWLFVKLQMK